MRGPVQRGHSDVSGPLNIKLGELLKYHWKDWLLIVGLVVLEIPLQNIHPHKRYVGRWMFVTGELRYPSKRETVPVAGVAVVALVIPVVVVLGYYFQRREVRDLHQAVLGLFSAVILTAVITDSLKDGVGRPRPDFYARCFGSPTAQDYYDSDGNVACNGSASVIREGRKSFPSGHASWSFAGMGYLAMYLAGKCGMFDRRGHSWKLLPVSCPLLWAIFVGISRLEDYWHHWTDVFGGALIGLGAAYFFYRQHFPSVFDNDAANPYAHWEVLSLPRCWPLNLAGISILLLLLMCHIIISVTVHQIIWKGHLESATDG